MLPSSTAKNLTHSTLAYPVAISYQLLRFSRISQSINLYHIAFRKLRIPSFFAATCRPFLGSVLIVVSLCSKKEMVRVYTSSIVTMWTIMENAHSRRNISIVEDPRCAVGWGGSSFTNTNGPIPGFCDARFPNPAFRGFFDFLHKSFSESIWKIRSFAYFRFHNRTNYHDSSE